MSPETFAKIAKARVDEAIKKNTAKGIKETTRQPSADTNGETDGFTIGMTQEQFDKLSYNERVELFNSDRETYNKFNSKE
jgi:hypothetical protein